MNRKTADSLQAKKTSGLVPRLETALLGGQAGGLGQTRVMAANFQSRFVNPADLDAFLQGYLKGF
ncbi:MAG: hypothetical protein V1816_28350 [Pseudomonadota bacterium]